MSTPLPPPALFHRLFDDAAVFPPGSFTLEEALDRRMRRRGGPLAPFVGPLLLPPRLVDEALTSVSPLDIVVVGRPGARTGRLLDAAAEVIASPSHSLAGIELPHADGWRAALPTGVPLAVEVPAGPQGLGAIGDLAGTGDQVRAKLRTGSTSSTPVPSAADLAAFIRACRHVGVAFKLTGGLHHAVTGRRSGSGDTEFGFLDVLVATDAALDDADLHTVEDILQVRDAEVLAARLRRIPPERAVLLRSHFHSYGCCNVLDPIHDLARLTLIEDPAMNTPS